MTIPRHSFNSKDPIPIVMDVDPGVDDALAVMLALTSPEVEVLGMTVVSGNVPVDLGLKNALAVVEMLDRPDLPVYLGADRPLERQPVYATEIHGSTGLGRAALPAPRGKAAGEAVPFLIEVLSSRPGDVAVVACGPLTNLALAEKQSPGILKTARQVVVMGGAIDAPGNVTPSAEFNFFVDPHAARIVVAAGGALTLTPLDVTQQVALSTSDLRSLLVRCETPSRVFTIRAVEDMVEYARLTGGYQGIYLHDPVAVGVLVCPQFFEDETIWLDVETGGELSMGRLVADRRTLRSELRTGVPVRCITGAKADRFVQLFLDRVLG